MDCDLTGLLSNRRLDNYNHGVLHTDGGSRPKRGTGNGTFFFAFIRSARRHSRRWAIPFFRAFLYNLTMRLLQLNFFYFCISIGFATASANAYPSWSSYRTMSASQRAEIDRAMVALVSKIPADGFKTKRIKFCVVETKLWETSLNASCDSTRVSANVQTWPPVMTNSGFEPSWVAHARLATAYCTKTPSEKICEPFELFGTNAEKAEADTFSLNRKMNWPAWVQLSKAAIQGASAAETCKVENDTLTTKSGSTIFLDFGVQPGAAHAEALTALALLAAQDKMPDSAVKDGVDSIQKIGKVLVNNARLKQPWVEARIKQDHVTWIGTEFTEREIGDRIGKKMAASFAELKEQLKSRKVTKSAARDAMTIGACPTAPACAWLHDANLQSKTSLVPLASDDLKKKRLTLEQQQAEVLSELKALETDGKIKGNEYTAIEKEYRGLLIAADPPDARAQNRARLRYSAVGVRKVMVALYTLAVEIKKNDKESDEAIVKAALDQPGNGIFAMGTLARDRMIPMLEDVCRGPIAPPAAPSKRKSTKPKPQNPTSS
jgi:hypothetical protein